MRIKSNRCEEGDWAPVRMLQHVSRRLGLRRAGALWHCDRPGCHIGHGSFLPKEQVGPAQHLPGRLYGASALLLENACRMLAHLVITRVRRPMHPEQEELCRQRSIVNVCVCTQVLGMAKIDLADEVAQNLQNVVC